MDVSAPSLHSESTDSLICTIPLACKIVILFEQRLVVGIVVFLCTYCHIGRSL